MLLKGGFEGEPLGSLFALGHREGRARPYQGRESSEDRTTSGYLSFDLGDILSNLGLLCPSLDWYLLYIEAESLPGSGIHMLELERETSSSKHGKKLTWTQLVDLACGLSQTTNCVIVGVFPNCEPPQLPLQKKYAEDKVIISAFDSTYWTVCAPQLEVIQQLRSTFRTTQMVEYIDYD